MNAACMSAVQSLFLVAAFELFVGRFLSLRWQYCGCLSLSIVSLRCGTYARRSRSCVGPIQFSAQSSSAESEVLPVYYSNPRV